MTELHRTFTFGSSLRNQAAEQHSGKGGIKKLQRRNPRRVEKYKEGEAKKNRSAQVIKWKQTSFLICAALKMFKVAQMQLCPDTWHN